MSAEYFIDTNVLVYTFDQRARKKQKRARELVAAALQEASGVISWQVVQEFLNVATRKFTKPMDYHQANQYYLKILRPLCAVHSTPLVYTQALMIRAETGFGFYDALIVASALEAGCRILYSEDLQHGQEVRSLTIENPFR